MALGFGLGFVTFLILLCPPKLHHAHAAFWFSTGEAAAVRARAQLKFEGAMMVVVAANA
jgi:hypothetical protein